MSTENMPTWIINPHVTLIRTHNGWAVAPDPQTPIEQCVTFETWDALVYWLAGSFGARPEA